MQINRLFEIVYILFDKKTTTARELAEHFEVSKRTIYRDIETLSMAGIPIYTNKGKGGGINILPEFILNKSLLSASEQDEILSGLQSLSALNVPNVDPVLNKLAIIFNKKNASWIDVDFSHWGSDDSEKEKFRLLKNAILEKNVIIFDYYSSYGEISKQRFVEPMKLVFKGQSWYVYGYCKLKAAYRMFKVTRIKNLVASNDSFNRNLSKDILDTSDDSYKTKMITIVLKIHSKMAYRVFDEFCTENITRNADGSFTVKSTVPESDWIYGYIMSYGEYAEVLEPIHIREIIVNKFKEGLKKYL